MVKPTFSAGLWVFAQSEEKFGGYNRALPVREQIAAAASVPGLKGLELISPLHVSLENVKEVQGWLEECELKAIAINPYIWTEPQFSRGALTSPDPQVRQQAVDRAKEAIEIGHILGSSKMCLWPGEDGYDYLFQTDYRELWDRTAECVRQIAEFDPGTRIGIEYKPVEPRMHQLVSSAAKAALLGAELGLPNVGAYLDFGHAIISKETPAESVALLSRHHRLVGVHANDNYGLGDDDLMVGTVHVWSTLEFLLALEEADYDGWISLDIVPRRESPVKASIQSIRALENLLGMLDKLDRAGLRKAQAEMDAVAAQHFVQELLVA
jgi:xylose isomerase